MFNVQNSCQFEGRLVKDPVISTQQVGNNSYTKALFTLAVDRTLTTAKRAAAKNDKSIITADFVQFSAMGPNADFIAKWFTKGKPMHVYATYSTWQTPNKITPSIMDYKHGFVVEQISFTISDTTGNNNNNGGNNNNQNNNNNGGGNNNYQNNNNNNNQNQNQNNNNNGNNQNNNNKSNDYVPVDDADIPF